MTATTGYSAGAESTFVTMGFIKEAAWGVLPATPQLKALRLTGETLAGSKNRQRPNEINQTREASASVTTEETAGGTINFGLSVGTFDDFFAGLMGSEWATDVLNNGIEFQSYYIEKSLGNGQFFVYPGSYITGATISAQRGQFVSGSFTVASKDEENATATASTAAYTPAPSGRIMSPTGSVRSITMGGTAIAAPLNQFTLNISNNGAAQDYGLGTPKAIGQRMGTFTVNGTIEAYFRDNTLYTAFKNETFGALAIEMVDDTNHGYRFTVLQAAVMNPKINANNGPNQPVMASFTLEGNPAAGGGTLKIERLSPS